MSYDANFEQFEAVNDKAETEAPDHAALEGQDGLTELNQQTRQEQEELKAGGRSGITGEFGRPVILDQDMATYDTGRSSATLGDIVKPVPDGNIKPYADGSETHWNKKEGFDATDDEYNPHKSPELIDPAEELKQIIDKSGIKPIDDELGLILPAVQRQAQAFWLSNDDLSITPETEHVMPKPGDITDGDSLVSWSWGETSNGLASDQSGVVNRESGDNQEAGEGDEDFPGMDWMGDPEDNPQNAGANNGIDLDLPGLDWNEKVASIPVGMLDDTSNPLGIWGSGTQKPAELVEAEKEARASAEGDQESFPCGEWMPGPDEKPLDTLAGLMQMGVDLKRVLNARQPISTLYWPVIGEM